MCTCSYEKSVNIDIGNIRLWFDTEMRHVKKQDFWSQLWFDTEMRHVKKHDFLLMGAINYLFWLKGP
jgi:hypothetical protein